MLTNDTICVFVHTSPRKGLLVSTLTESNRMNAISLQYRDLSAEALVKIFQLADLLEVTPKKAAELYLATRAATQTQSTKAA